MYPQVYWQQDYGKNASTMTINNNKCQLLVTLQTARTLVV